MLAINFLDLLINQCKSSPTLVDYRRAELSLGCRMSSKSTMSKAPRTIILGTALVPTCTAHLLSLIMAENDYGQYILMLRAAA